MRSAGFLCLLWLVALPLRAQWQAAGFVGGAHTQDSFLSVRQPALGTILRFHPVAFSGKSFQGPLYYGGRGGYFFSRYLGVEAEYIHLKVFARVDRPGMASGVDRGTPISTELPLGNIVQRFSISHGVNLLMANAALRHPVGASTDQSRPRLLLNLRAGLGVTIPHPETQINGVADEHYQVGSMVFQLAPGAELRLWDRVYWLADYKYTHTRQRVDIFSGTAETLLNSHHGVTGISLHF